jgi:hypothetical protein
MYSRSTAVMQPWRSTPSMIAMTKSVGRIPRLAAAADSALKVLIGNLSGNSCFGLGLATPRFRVSIGVPRQIGLQKLRVFFRRHDMRKALFFGYAFPGRRQSMFFGLAHQPLIVGTLHSAGTVAALPDSTGR